MQEIKHYKFSPSSFDRWSKCSMSISDELTSSDESTEYAIAGKTSHQGLEEGFITKYIENEPIAHLEKNIRDCINYVDELIKSVIKVKDIFKNEDEIHFIGNECTVVLVLERTITSIKSKDFGGTPDIILYSFYNESKSILAYHVIDYKSGSRGLIRAYNNKQLICYAVLFYEQLLRSKIYHVPENFNEITLHIVQPDRDNYCAHKIEESIDALDFKVFSAIEEAKNQPRYKMGKWCQYCPKFNNCPARFRKSLARATTTMSLSKLTNEQLDQFCYLIPIMKRTFERGQQILIERIKSGYEPKNCRFVEKKSNRSWTNLKEAEKVLPELIKCDIYNKSILSPAQAEKALKTKAFKPKINELCSREATGYTLKMCD